MSDKNYVYLLQEREFVRMDEHIYKIGMSTQIKQRLNSKDYKDCEKISIWPCVDCESLENTIIREFKQKFTLRKEFGREYFEGDYNEMRRAINKIIDDELTNNSSASNEPRVETENEKLCKKNASLEIEIKKLNTKIESLALEKKVILCAGTKYADDTVSINKITILEREQRVLKDRICGYIASIKKLNNDIETYKNMIIEKQKECDEFDSERIELNFKINKYRNKFENIEDEYNSKLKGLENLKETNNKLTDDLDKIFSIVCKKDK